MRLIFLLLLSLTITACYYDSKEYLFPKVNNNCDTSNVSFTGTIKPILTSYCFACHSNNTAGAGANGIALENYADARLAGEDGSLSGSIKHDAGYSPMPLGGGKLDDCSIELINSWILNNYPEN